MGTEPTTQGICCKGVTATAANARGITVWLGLLASRTQSLFWKSQPGKLRGINEGCCFVPFRSWSVPSVCHAQGFSTTLCDHLSKRTNTLHIRPILSLFVGAPDSHVKGSMQKFYNWQVHSLQMHAREPKMEVPTLSLLSKVAHATLLIFICFLSPRWTVSPIEAALSF